MAITFPRPFPSTRIRVSNFNPRFVGHQTPLASGDVDVSSDQPARWYGEFELVPQTSREAAVALAWYASLKGGFNTFEAYDPDYLYPYTYNAGFDGLIKYGGGAFTGDAVVAALTATTITVSGLPVNFVLLEGDRVGLKEGGAQGLYIVLEDVTASAGGVATVHVSPFVETGLFTAAATAHFAKPTCLMTILNDKWTRTRAVSPNGISFAGNQRYR